jgi:hypothetical protein
MLCIHRCVSLANTSDLYWSEVEAQAVGVIIQLVGVINTGPFVLLLTSWGSPRDLKGRMSAGVTLRGAGCDLAAFCELWAFELPSDPLFLLGLTSCAGSPLGCG